MIKVVIKIICWLHFSLLAYSPQESPKTPVVKKPKEANSEVYKNGLAYQCLLRNELLGTEIEDISEYKHSEDRKAFTPILNRNVFRVSKIVGSLMQCNSFSPKNLILKWVNHISNLFYLLL